MHWELFFELIIMNSAKLFSDFLIILAVLAALFVLEDRNFSYVNYME